MNETPFQGAFNAKWLKPQEVARRFVPIPQFQKLTHKTNSVLLGPRGSGKTTLLKMLTSEAINTWKNEREQYIQHIPFEYPDFEAIYIPSDIRWSYEIASLEKSDYFSPDEVTKLQRAMVSSSVLISLLNAIEAISKRYRLPEIDVCNKIIRICELNNTVPIFFDIRSEIRKIASNIRSAINCRSKSKVNDILDNISQIFYGHVIDAPILVCNILTEMYSRILEFQTWALCFDELEIAPVWLRNEILEALRSIEQNYILKLTWSPLLPTGLINEPEPKDDFTPIRLWHSHVVDSRRFCEELTDGFLKISFPENTPNTDEFLSYSALALENEENGLDIYRRGSTIYEEMKSLASEDITFKKLLENNNIDPLDPYSESTNIRNSILRKIKPIVLLRRTFLSGDKIRRRSRKLVTLYAGKQAVYAMSEGNPRWLLGLLTDLYDRWKTNPNYGTNSTPKIPYSMQARCLNNAARRFESYLSAIASIDEKSNIDDNESLYDFLKRIANCLKNQFLGPQFPLDPFGSFSVDIDSYSIEIKIKRALEVGALVYVGNSDEDVPRRIFKSRFRLSFMLSPIFRLPLRNYRAIALNSIIGKSISDSSNKQMKLF